MVDREFLKEKYGDEEVFVVPLGKIRELGLDENGYRCFRPNDIKDMIAKLEEFGYFIPRWKSDENPREVEIISYVSIVSSPYDTNAYYTYKRVKNGDARGNGKLSIGVGGHINPIDKTNPIIVSAIREVQEEVGVIIEPSSLSPRGFLRLNTTTFDGDHLGIHFVVTKDNCYSTNEPGKMMPLGYIIDDALREVFNDSLENWTKMIVGGR